MGPLVWLKIAQPLIGSRQSNTLTGARCDERQLVSHPTSLAARRAPFRTNASRHRFEKTIHNVKYRKRRLNAVPPRVNHGDLVRFIIQDRNCLRARVPVSRSKAAPCGCASRRWPFSKRCVVASLRRLRFCELVEPIGIEPMTS